MAFALLIIGIVLVTAAIRDTQDELIGLLGADFTGAGNFIYWVAALVIVGSVGYVERLKPISDGLLVLIILALFLSKGNPKGAGGGFFQQFTQALGTTKTPAGGAGKGPINFSATTLGNTVVGATSGNLYNFLNPNG